MAPDVAKKNKAALTAKQAPWTYWMESATHYAHFPLRIAVASVFLFHGLSKFVDGVGGFADAMGLPVFAAFLVAVAEVTAGATVLVGAFERVPFADLMTRLAGAIVMVIMIGAIGIVHWPRWAFTATDAYPMGGMELQASMALVGLYLAMRGNRI